LHNRFITRSNSLSREGVHNFRACRLVCLYVNLLQVSCLFAPIP